jgi:hypothetical protein
MPHRNFHTPITANDRSTSINRNEDLNVKVNFTPFSGREPVPKHESSFEEFKLEFESVKNMYSEPVLKRALMRSLKDHARKTMLHLGTQASIEDIMKSLEENFGDVASQDCILSRFLTAEQTGDESIVEWSLRLEEMLLQICRKTHMDEKERKERLKNRFWRGLRSGELKQATRACFDSTMSFEDLRNKVRAEEFEIKLLKERSNTKVKPGKLNQTSVGSCPVQTEDTLTRLLKQVQELDKKVEEMKESQERQQMEKQDGKNQRGGVRGARGSRGSSFRGSGRGRNYEGNTEEAQTQCQAEEPLNA